MMLNMTQGCFKEDRGRGKEDISHLLKMTRPLNDKITIDLVNNLTLQ